MEEIKRGERAQLSTSLARADRKNRGEHRQPNDAQSAKLSLDGVFYIGNIIKDGFDLHNIKKFGDSSVPSRYVFLTSILF